MRSVGALVSRYAASPTSTILITGESGTGKDLVAKALHAQSSRSAGPFTNITCSALTDTLLESELFGHERGAFTGAHAAKPGLLELCDGGTAFLDEIGEMTPSLQAKLLRFLESKTFRHVGGTKDILANVRIIAATHRDLQAEVTRGRFRQDLYYRISVLEIVLPPLRERAEDIPLLVAHLVERFSAEFSKPPLHVAPEAMSMLVTHRWPGNVRELRNVIERAVLLCDGDTLTTGMLTLGSVPPPPRFELPRGGIDLEMLEEDLLRQALDRSGGNLTQAGRLLGLSRDQVRYRLKNRGRRAARSGSSTSTSAAPSPRS